MVEITKSIAHMLRARADTTKTKAKKKEHKAKGYKPSEMNTAVLRNMFRMSRGYCAATNTKFVCKPKDPQNFSLDRINSNKGYTIDNVWLVCDWYNKGKGKMSVEQFNKILGDI